MVSVERVRAAVPAAVSQETTLIADMIERATAFVQTQTGRYFGPIVTATDYLDGRGGRFLGLSQVAIPNENGELVLVEERAYPGGTATVVLPADYQVRNSDRLSTLVRLGGDVWTRGLEYAVTYERGYDVDGGPPDVSQLVIDLIALRLKFIGKEGMRSETIGGYSYTRFGEGDLDSIDGAKATINAWRRPVLV
jgi:hypothetical protein